MLRWGEYRYHALDHELKQRFGGKVWKLSLDGGMTCPNRDGTLGTGGCIFCSAGGSGDFAADASLSVAEQLRQQKERLLASGKLPPAPSSSPSGSTGSAAQENRRRYIAYFQAYTNTYAPPSRLEQLFSEAVSDPEVCALSIATRPDVLPPEVIDLLKRLNRQKSVWVELGLQTIHEDTARRIRRGYALPVFDQAVRDLRSAGIEVIVHTILGLPGETRSRMLETVEYLGRCDIQGIKLQLLHILSGTDLAQEYCREPFPVFSREEYLDLVIRCLEILPPQIVIHRLTGDGPKDLLIAPLWSRDKRSVLNELRHRMAMQDTWQGRCFTP